MSTHSKNTITACCQIQKTIFSFLIMATIASTCLSCLDGLDDINFQKSAVNVDFTDHYLWPGPITIPRMTIGIDSAEETNDSTIRFWIRAKYDSVIVRSAYGISYAKMGDTQALTKIFLIEPDTIDFRILPNLSYAFDVEIRSDSLKSKATYAFCPFIDYLSEADTIRLSGSSFGKCHYFETK